MAKTDETNKVLMRKGTRDAPNVEWEDTLVSTKKTRLTKPRTVILCGFANSSRHLAPYDKRTVEIWGLNEAYNVGFMKNSKGEFRVDRWFQLHMLEDWSRRGNNADLRHPEWLRSDHNFPIYMEEAYPDVPNAVKYPLDDLDKKFFSNIYLIHPITGEELPYLEVYGHGYYTSSFAYMIALAIYEGFERIEIFGFNMGAQSEYMYQKACCEFWIGEAITRGIDIVIAGNSPILTGELYGYEFSQILQLPHLLSRDKELTNSQKVPQSKMEFARGARDTAYRLLVTHEEWPKDVQDELQAVSESKLYDQIRHAGDVNYHAGALYENTHLMNFIRERQAENPEFSVDDGWVGRTYVEARFGQSRNFRHTAEFNLAAGSGAKLELKRILETEELPDELRATLIQRSMTLDQNEVDRSNMLNRIIGAMAESKLSMLSMDQRTPNYVDEFGLDSRVTLEPDTELDVTSFKLVEDDDEVGEDDNGGEEDPPEES